MATPQLHDALKCLRPRDFASDVPLDDLEAWMCDIFANCEIIINSVPQPPGGADFLTSRRKRTDVNGARSAAEMTVADARAPSLDPSFDALRKLWGNPLKTNPNPLAIAVYKMAGADRYGSWFARRSVHEGLGFTKWKRALEREFAESLAVQGGPGAGSIRGIGGDRQLEDTAVPGLGRLQVLQLSAKFPAPTAPREFITMLLTSDRALSGKSRPRLDALDVPRHYMIVSIPCEHAEAPGRGGLVRGQYESIEMIREIPLVPLRTTHEGSVARDEESSPEDPEGNPVEWIMITRSDPGGGIPRFLIDRGTPGSIVGDTSKFLDWACARDDMMSLADPVEKEAVRAEHAGADTSIADMTLTDSSAVGNEKDRDGLSPSFPVNHEENGTRNHACAAVASLLQSTPRSSDPHRARDDSSIDSFASAEQWAIKEDESTDEQEKVPPLPPRRSSEGSIGSDPSKGRSTQQRFDQEMQKLDSKRMALDEKMRKRRVKELAREQQETERKERERRKAADKYQREMRRLASKREKEEKKNALVRLQREYDGLKLRVEMTERENALLKEQVGQLQHQNTQLVRSLGKTEQGKMALECIGGETDSGIVSAASSVKNKGSDGAGL